jgi:hypothetical protein
MGLHGYLSQLGLDWLNGVVLVVSLVTFTAVVAWTVTRSRREMDAHARLPLGGDGSASIPQESTATRRPEHG